MGTVLGALHQNLRTSPGGLDMTDIGKGKLNHWFGVAAKRTARAAGHPATFLAAVLIVVIWAIVGPLFGFSDAWQLVINTGTTIVTFLMVFLIQNTQNRDSEAVQLKLDELLRALNGAENALIDLEDMDVEELDRLRTQYAEFADKARHALDEKGEQRPASRHASKRKPSRAKKSHRGRVDTQ